MHNNCNSCNQSSQCNFTPVIPNASEICLTGGASSMNNGRCGCGCGCNRRRRCGNNFPWSCANQNNRCDNRSECGCPGRNRCGNGSGCGCTCRNRCGNGSECGCSGRNRCDNRSECGCSGRNRCGCGSENPWSERNGCASLLDFGCNGWESIENWAGICCPWPRHRNCSCDNAAVTESASHCHRKAIYTQKCTVETKSENYPIGVCDEISSAPFIVPDFPFFNITRCGVYKIKFTLKLNEDERISTKLFLTANGNKLCDTEICISQCDCHCGKEFIGETVLTIDEPVAIALISSEPVCIKSDGNCPIITLEFEKIR